MLRLFASWGGGGSAPLMLDLAMPLISYYILYIGLPNLFPPLELCQKKKKNHTHFHQREFLIKYQCHSFVTAAAFFNLTVYSNWGTPTSTCWRFPRWLVVSGLHQRGLCGVMVRAGLTQAARTQSWLNWPNPLEFSQLSVSRLKVKVLQPLWTAFA